GASASTSYRASRSRGRRSRMSTWTWSGTAKRRETSHDRGTRRYCDANFRASSPLPAVLGAIGGGAEAVLPAAGRGVLLVSAPGALRGDLLERLRRGHRRAARGGASAVPAVLRGRHDRS